MKKPEVVRVAFAQWKKDNNYTCKCVIHHRDDTEETRAYNKAHYERWGCNEDGTFEYGKYVVFMTNREHVSYHHKGNKNPMYGIHRFGIDSPMYGKIPTDETKAKMSLAHQGKRHTDETKAKMSQNHADFHGEKSPRYGKKHTEEAKAKMSFTHKQVFIGIKVLYAAYKQGGGTKKWNEFQKALANGEITIETLPISVFVK